MVYAKAAQNIRRFAVLTQGTGGILCRNHVAEAFFFALQLEQEFAQAVGLGLMGFGRFGPREGRDAAQDLRFPGCCASPAPMTLPL